MDLCQVITWRVLKEYRYLSLLFFYHLMPFQIENVCLPSKLGLYNLLSSHKHRSGRACSTKLTKHLFSHKKRFYIYITQPVFT